MAWVLLMLTCTAACACVVQPCKGPGCCLPETYWVLLIKRCNYWYGTGMNPFLVQWLSLKGSWSQGARCLTQL
jgi:hypothetical protein